MPHDLLQCAALSHRTCAAVVALTGGLPRPPTTPNKMHGLGQTFNLTKMIRLSRAIYSTRASLQCVSPRSFLPLFSTMAAASASFSEPAVIGVVPEFSTGVEPLKFAAEAQLTADTVVFVGEQQYIEAAAQTSGAVGSFLTQNQVVKLGLVDKLSAASDSPVTTETLVMQAAAGKTQRVVIITLPKVAGRHNCAARPHAIRAALVDASLHGTCFRRPALRRPFGTKNFNFTNLL